MNPSHGILTHARIDALVDSGRREGLDAAGGHPAPAHLAGPATGPRGPRRSARASCRRPARWPTRSGGPGRRAPVPGRGRGAAPGPRLPRACWPDRWRCPTSCRPAPTRARPPGASTSSPAPSWTATIASTTSRPGTRARSGWRSCRAPSTCASSAGMRLNQARFISGDPRLRDDELVRRAADDRTWCWASMPSRSSRPRCYWACRCVPIDPAAPVGWRARPDAPVLDLEAVGMHEPLRLLRAGASRRRRHAHPGA